MYVKIIKAYKIVNVLFHFFNTYIYNPKNLRNVLSKKW